MATRPPRIFTVEKANDLVATLTGVMEEIRRLSAEARESHEHLQVLDVLWGEKVQAAGNPDHGDFHTHLAAVGGAVQRIEALINEEILARGIRFPVGGLEHGLLDFPTVLDGRAVFLCWKLGEPEVLHWHEVDGGFAGRRPVTPDVARRMGSATS